jgi:uncharacterized protein YabE (DUF348 family)
MSTLVAGEQSAVRTFGKFSPLAVDLAAIIVVVGLLAVLASLTARPITVTVDGMSDTVRTHRRDVDKLLIDLGMTDHTAVRVAVANSESASRPMAIEVERARPLRVLADGRDLHVDVWAQTPAGVLTAVGVSYDPADRVLIDGVSTGLEDALPPPLLAKTPRSFNHGYAWNDIVRTPSQLRLTRSTPIVIEDGGLAFNIRSTAQTVGEALRDAKITLYLGDRVQPSLGSPISNGLRVSIQRSTPLSLEVDGVFTKTRARAETVADLLSEMNVGLSGLDQVTPPPQTPLYDNIAIKVTRVSEDVEISEEIAPFETVFEPDANLPIDTQQTIAPGAEGITRTRERVRYENGEEVDRLFEDTWIAQEPAQRVIAYGTQISPKTITTDDGRLITYWRKIRMRASSYSAGTAGLSPDHPWYGKTYTGEPMRQGVVAVDPKIIPLRSQVYVPGYGIGDALDTGSAIRSRRIDLGFDDASLELWARWVDVYLLWPPPADYQITWVVPNWPRVPQ